MRAWTLDSAGSRAMNNRGATMVPQQNRSRRDGVSAHAIHDSFIIGPDDRILVTGAAGFIGSRVVEDLLDRGFRNLVCFTRPSSELAGLESIIKRHPPEWGIAVLRGNLLSRQDCEAACQN